MSQQLLRTILALSVILTTSAPAADLAVLEDAIETSTLSVSVPTDDAGSMAVKPCQTCPATLLRLTPESTYRVGRSEVAFKEFASYVRDAGTRNLTILYNPKNRTITRLVVAGKLAGPPPQR